MELSDSLIYVNVNRTQCIFCCGFYESSHGQPVCNTCHLFLFANENGELERSSATEDDQNGDDQQSLDSGNEEPVDERELIDGTGDNLTVVNGRSRSSDRQNNQSSRFNAFATTEPGDSFGLPTVQDELNRRIRALSHYRPQLSLHSQGVSELANSTSSSHTRNCRDKPDVASRVPEEVLVERVFPFLDDIQLFMCSRVCRRWKRIILGLNLPWKHFVKCRWPLFCSQYRVSDWYEIYSRLVDSTCCHRCLWSISPTYHIEDTSFLANTQHDSLLAPAVPPAVPPPAVNRGWSVPVEVATQNFHFITSNINQNIENTNNSLNANDNRRTSNQTEQRTVFWPPFFVHSASTGVISSSRIDQDSWRNRRLLSEFQNLKCDPFLGIDAVRLDPGGYIWQATVEGPLGSPYEGGIFFIFMFIPENYPLKAPVVRFQTKILHPNVSLHGDIGIESIGGANWIPTLTLSKVLLSVLSLLTDPNCEICMNPEAARLYRTDHNRFNRLSKLFTYKYAMIDYIHNKSL